MGIFGSGSYHARGRFYGNLATALDAGLTPEHTLTIVKEKDGALGAATRPLEQAVRRGRALSEGMSRNAFWSPFEVSSVVAAERSGRLPEMLRRLSGYFATRGRTRDRIRNVLIYPTIVLHAAVLLPPLFLLVRDGLGAYLAGVVPVLAVIYGIGAALFWFYRVTTSSAAGRQRVDQLLLSLPLVGPTARELAVADYAYLVGSLLATGAPILEALNLAAEASRNAVFRAAGARVAMAVTEGATLYEALQREEVFPRLFVAAVRVGETAGNLDDSLERAERGAREEADVAIERLLTVAPILALAGAGLVVGFVAVSFLGNIFGGASLP
jgi:type II secretory pathway component PulF